MFSVAILRKKKIVQLISVVFIFLSCYAIGASVVKQGSASLSFEDIDARILEIPKNDREGFMVPKRIESTLSQLLLIKQLAHEARELKLDKTSEYVLRKQLAEDRMLASMMQEYTYNHTPKIDAKALAKEAYLANPKRFVTRDMATIRQIVFKLDCRSPAAAKQLAEDTLARLRKKQDSFEVIAKEVSEDVTTSMQGGLVQKPIQPTGNPDLLEKTVFNLKNPGDISDIIETEYGYYIVQLVKAESAGKPLSYEEVEDKLIAEIEQQNKSQVVIEHNEKLMNNKMDADPDLVYSLRTRYKDGNIPGVKE